MRYQHFFILLISLVFISCHPRDDSPRLARAGNLSLSDLNNLYSLHTHLVKPALGDWLDVLEEKGQSFDDYINYKAVCPSANQNKIYIQLIGEFDSIDNSIIKTVADYINAFYGLKVVLLDAISDSIIPDNSRRMNEYAEQLLTKYILYDILLPVIPKDAIVLNAITSKDLYPDEDWNFVFGQAALKKRVGVSSLYRYKYDNPDSVAYALYLRRLMRTATHELGHMFSLKHCIEYKCLMNGSNSLSEADTKPLWLCPNCLAKISWCTQYDILERYDNLIEFFGELGFVEESKFLKESKKVISNQK